MNKEIEHAAREKYPEWVYVAQINNHAKLHEDEYNAAIWGARFQAEQSQNEAILFGEYLLKHCTPQSPLFNTWIAPDGSRKTTGELFEQF